MHRSFRRAMRWALWLAPIGLAVLAGCGEAGRGGVRVTGEVTLDGAPMPAGSVVFVPLASGHRAAATIVDGAFELAKRDGPIPGRYRVEVYAAQASLVALDDPLAYARRGPAVPPPNPVAPQYNTRSVLQIDVTAEGNNEFTFEVESTQR